MGDLEEVKRLLGEALADWTDDPLLRDYRNQTHPDQIRRKKITDALSLLENMEEGSPAEPLSRVREGGTQWTTGESAKPPETMHPAEEPGEGE